MESFTSPISTYTNDGNVDCLADIKIITKLKQASGCQTYVCS